MVEEHEADREGVGQGDVPELRGRRADEERVPGLEGAAEAVLGRAQVKEFPLPRPAADRVSVVVS